MPRTTRTEWYVLLLFALSLVWGIWHALPEITIVRDESMYVGDVLRAIQAHTLVPHIGASYVLSFYANYLLMLPVLGILFVLNHASISLTTTFLFDHYWALYFVPRTVSVLASIALAYVLLATARVLGRDLKTRVAYVALILSTIVIAAIMHTGKMWALTSFLVVAANYAYARARYTTESSSWFRSPVFWCVGSAVLATTNFPVAFVALVAPALLYWQSSSIVRARILKYALLWVPIGAGLTLLNLHGWSIQNDTTLPGSLFAPGATFLFEVRMIVLLAPLVLVGLLAVRFVRNTSFFYLVLAEAGLFMLTLALRAPWLLIITEVERYFFLIIMLLGSALLATETRYPRALYALCGISLIFFLKTIMLLGVPTTYNNAYTFAADNLSTKPVVVAKAVPHLDLPMNGRSYALIKKEFCVSRCEHALQSATSSNEYLVLLPGLDDPTRAPATSTAQYVFSSKTMEGGELIRTWGRNPNTDDYYAINYRVGRYTLAYLTLSQLGENIYLYRF